MKCIIIFLLLLSSSPLLYLYVTILLPTYLIVLLTIYLAFLHCVMAEKFCLLIF